MAQYAVMIFERETPGGVADVPPEIMKAHEEHPAKVAEQGGRVVAGMALERDGRLADDRYLPATEAGLLRRLGRDAEAADAYQAALDLAGNAAEQEFLAERVRSTRS